MKIFTRNPCDGCGRELTNWDYRYRGKHYCRTCCDRLFPVGTCEVCGKRKRIHRELVHPVCKICQVRNKPCIRCGREVVRPGKILESGPLCASCANALRPEKRCPECGEESKEVFRRRSMGGKTMCQRCYRKKLPLCTRCHRHRPCTETENGPVCVACLKGDVSCRECRKPIPAGRGKICRKCAANHSLKRKEKFGRGALPPLTAEAFSEFSRWFARHRGPEVAALRLTKYLPFFMDIGEMEEKTGRFPEYGELAGVLGVKRLWENRMAVTFLDESGRIEKDAGIQAEIAEHDMIARMLSTFPRQSLPGKALAGYYAVLEERLLSGKTTVRSIRLALTPAARLLHYLEHGGRAGGLPSRMDLVGYLWLFPGQKSALTGFSNYLDSRYGTGLEIRTVPRPVLERPNVSEAYLEQRMIRILRDGDYRRRIGPEEMLRVATAYFHRVAIPRHVRPLFVFSKKKRLLKMAGEEFFFPSEICLAIGSTADDQS